MPNAIEQARDAVYEKLQTLPDLGLRNDYRLILKRYPPETSGDELSMDPSDKPNRIAESSIEVLAPEVKLFSGFGFTAITQGMGGGVIQLGDHIVRFPRATAIESYLNERTAAPELETDTLYPEMAFIVFELNGVDYRPIRWIPEAIFLKVYIRKVS